MNYTDFINHCLEKLQAEQEVFMKKFDINAYPNWFYDQASGIFTFSSEKDEINFRYITIGTYSKVAKTWKWSWDNEHTFDKVKKPTEQIKKFGKEKNYESLYTGLLETDEETCWEFCAVAKNILGGLGIYRPEIENLLIFELLIEQIDNQTANIEKDKFVDCEDHERRRRAFVCQHLIKSKNLGFHEAFETYEDMEFEYEDDDFMAWCNQCEQVRLKTDGWNDESMEFAKIKLICEKCYFDLKSVNL